MVKFFKKKGEHAPFIHDLMRLAQKSGLELSEEQADQLDEISTFNINARYDNYQEEFYHRCTHDYTELWIKQIKEIEIWLQNQL